MRNPLIVRTKDDFLAMFRCLAEDQPGLQPQLEAVIRAVEAAGEPAANAMVRQLCAKQAWQPVDGPAYFNELALSTLPLVTLGRFRAQWGLVLERLRIYNKGIKDITIVVTPEMDYDACAVAVPSQCRLSLGMVVMVTGACLGLACLEQSVHASAKYLEHCIPDARSRLLDTVGARIDAGLARRLQDDDFGATYRPLQQFEDAGKILGISGARIDEMLTKSQPQNVLFGLVLGNAILRFLTLHELAHLHFGHPQLFHLWLRNPKLAKKLTSGEFPSPDARRSMECVADVWATDMFLVMEINRSSATLTDSILERDSRNPEVKVRFAGLAISTAFQLLGALEAAEGGYNHFFRDLVQTLDGSITDIYPGAMSRLAFATLHGPRLTTQRWYAHWLWWRRAKRELIASREFKEMHLQVLRLWDACGIAGGMLDHVKYGTTVFQSQQSSRGSDETWQMWDRFDFVTAHNRLEPDLEVAKRWCAQLP